MDRATAMYVKAAGYLSEMAPLRPLLKFVEKLNLAAVTEAAHMALIAKHAQLRELKGQFHADKRYETAGCIQ